jgi:hypothetical protein
MRATIYAWLAGLGIGVLIIGSESSAPAFPSGEPLAFVVDPATARQKNDQATMKVRAIVKLKEPSPAFFICQLHSQDAAKMAFPAIIFAKGDVKGTSDGLVHWKAVRAETRLHITAYNADAPDLRLSFTVTLIPVTEAPPPDGSGPNSPTD